MQKFNVCGKNITITKEECVMCLKTLGTGLNKILMKWKVKKWHMMEKLMFWGICTSEAHLRFMVTVVEDVSGFFFG